MQPEDLTVRQLAGFEKDAPSANPSLGEQAEATFRKLLPQLLLEKPGQWVAFHGTRLIGFARTDLELYRECRKQNIPAADCVVRPIEADPPDFLLFLDAPPT